MLSKKRKSLGLRKKLSKGKKVAPKATEKAEEVEVEVAEAPETSEKETSTAVPPPVETQEEDLPSVEVAENPVEVTPVKVEEEKADTSEKSPSQPATNNAGKKGKQKKQQKAPIKDLSKIKESVAETPPAKSAELTVLPQATYEDLRNLIKGTRKAIRYNGIVGEATLHTNQENDTTYPSKWNLWFQPKGSTKVYNSYMFADTIPSSLDVVEGALVEFELSRNGKACNVNILDPKAASTKLRSFLSNTVKKAVRVLSVDDIYAQFSPEALMLIEEPTVKSVVELIETNMNGRFVGVTDNGEYIIECVEC